MNSRKIKEKKFYELKNTKMPAALIECGFMTNLEDVKYMASWQGKHEISFAIFQAIMAYEILEQ